MRDIFVRLGTVGELLRFLLVRRHYWLIPLFLAVMVILALMIGASSGAGPFVYTIF